MELPTGGADRVRAAAIGRVLDETEVLADGPYVQALAWSRTRSP